MHKNIKYGSYTRGEYNKQSNPPNTLAERRMVCYNFTKIGDIII